MMAYIVMSSSGEYEDYRTHPVAVFTGRSASRKADAFAAVCRVYAETKPTPEPEDEDDEAWDRNYAALNAWKAAHPHDRDYDVDTTYRVLAVNLNPRVAPPSGETPAPKEESNG